MKNADKFVVGGLVYDVLSPATFGDYMETIGSACINPDGYAENKLFLAYDDNVQKLFRATTAIANSELLIKDTNCEPTTMAEALANALSAGGVSYDNTDSGLTASNVQDAIDEVNGDVETVNNDLSTHATANATEFAAVENVLGAKNLLPNTLAGTSQVIDGTLTVTVDNDGVVTANGSVGNDVVLLMVNNSWSNPLPDSLKPGGTYIASGGYGGYDSNAFWVLNFLDSSNNLTFQWFVRDMDKEFTIPSNTVAYTAYLVFTKNNSYSNVVMKPMIRPSGTDSTFVPYAKTNKELTDLTQDFTTNIVYNYTRISTGLSIFTYVDTFTFIGGKIKIVKAAVKVTSALTAKTRYLVGTNARFKSNVNWYHVAVIGRTSDYSELTGYVELDTNGNFYITPYQNVAVNDYLFIIEYFA